MATFIFDSNICSMELDKKRKSACAHKTKKSYGTFKFKIKPNNASSNLQPERVRSRKQSNTENENINTIKVKVAKKYIKKTEFFEEPTKAKQILRCISQEYLNNRERNQHTNVGTPSSSSSYS